MSKLPKVKKQVWKNYVPTKWMVWACEPNDVHHLVIIDGTVLWKRTSQIEDCKDVVVFNKLKKAQEFIRKCIKRKQLPSKDVNGIEYGRVVPTFENGKLWYEIYDARTGEVGSNKIKKENV
jgi:hypothetical protein